MITGRATENRKFFFNIEPDGTNGPQRDRPGCPVFDDSRDRERSEFRTIRLIMESSPFSGDRIVWVALICGGRVLRVRWSVRLCMFRVDYHQWLLVVAYVLLLSVFLYGVLRPRKRREWRSAGVAQAFVIALYAEMYGLPLSMYGVAWLTGRTEFAQDHFHGHAWAYLFGWGDTGAIWFDVIGQVLIVFGAVLALWGWRQIHRGQGGMIETGLYRHVRHPQYTGFYLFLVGSVVNWPTLPTLLMLPALGYVYYRLALSEEKDAEAEFGEAYRSYRQRSGMFLPRLRKTPVPKP